MFPWQQGALSAAQWHDRFGATRPERAERFDNEALGEGGTAGWRMHADGQSFLVGSQSYPFERGPRGKRRWYVVSPDLNHCSCLDFFRRSQWVGPCKHLIYMRRLQRQGQLPPRGLGLFGLGFDSPPLLLAGDVDEADLELLDLDIDLTPELPDNPSTL